LDGAHLPEHAYQNTTAATATLQEGEILTINHSRRRKHNKKSMSHLRATIAHLSGKEKRKTEKKIQQQNKFKNSITLQ